jgi:DNA invertase Pin-like site-specific DNA recombinase
MRVGIYARVSTTDKDQNPETQLLPLREFAAVQGWPIAGEFMDKAGATDLRGRVAWRSLLDEASKRRLDVILCWKLDRCFRSTLHAAETLERLRRWGVGLRSYTEAWADSTSPAGELMFTIATAFAAFERALIKERVRAGIDRAKREGKRFGRPGGTHTIGFEGAWERLASQVRSGVMSQREAAKTLGVARRTVQRLLAQSPAEPTASDRPILASSESLS